jgi:hypothetical protein
MDIAYWLPIVIQIGSVATVGGVLFEKVRQLERRLNGNGDSVPGRCKVHEAKLDNLERRVTAVESE